MLRIFPYLPAAFAAASLITVIPSMRAYPAAAAAVPAAKPAAASKTTISAPAKLPVAPHENASIEWWYVNAHVTTEKHRHLALVGAFFRFGNGHSILDPSTAQPRGHYLIYAVTDLDARTQRSYSIADANMVSMLKQIAPFLAAMNPSDAQAKALVAALNDGRLPSPHQQMETPAEIESSPFRLAYDGDDTLEAAGSTGKVFDLHLQGQPDRVTLRLTAVKPVMAVGGKGETGLTKPTDMYYFSQSRCDVTGTMDTGAGDEAVLKGQGWIDHQWGSSWVAQNDGWDWWGTQLTDGTDILFMRQRSLATGRTFFPLATIMDKSGHVTVTKNIQFEPDRKSLWKSPVTGIRYPLSWTVTFPDQHLRLRISAAVKSQEIPILGPGSAIWEGSCAVYGLQNARWRDLPADARADMAASLATDPSKRAAFSASAYKKNLLVTRGVNGVAYMELVGYNSAAVKADPLANR